MGRRGRRGGPYRVGDDDEAGEPRTVTARSRAIDAQLAYLAADGRVRAAAFVADTFKLDPVAVLAEREPLNVLIRLAAHNLLQNEADKARRKSGGK